MKRNTHIDHDQDPVGKSSLVHDAFGIVPGKQTLTMGLGTQVSAPASAPASVASDASRTALRDGINLESSGERLVDKTTTGETSGKAPGGSSQSTAASGADTASGHVRDQVTGDGGTSTGDAGSANGSGATGGRGAAGSSTAAAMRRAHPALLVIGLCAFAAACSRATPPSAQASASTASPPVPMSSNTDAHVPPHLAEFPGLSVHRGDDIVPAPEEDTRIARGYPSAPGKGTWIDQRRITLLTARLRVRVGEPVRVIHVSETTRAEDQLYVMGPKPIRGEHVDGELRTAPTPASGDPLQPAGLYDGRVMPAPAVDYNWDVTEYSFSSAGSHTIEWKLGALVSNRLIVDVTP